MRLMSKWTFLLLAILLAFLLYWRWQISLVRFFDIDEFSYMHWAAQVAHGQRQYVDFLSYFTPGFFWVFAPIFWIMGKTAQVFIAGRVVSFIVFLSILSALSYLWKITRNVKWAVLPAIILAFLPMPYDKLLEIRPDNLSALFMLLGVIGEIRAMQTKKYMWWLTAGLAYSASLFVLTKTIPVVAVGGIVAVISEVSFQSLKSLKAPKSLMYFGAGLIGPWILFFAGTALAGHFPVVWYSLTKLPFEVYKSSLVFPMEADLFFFPNASFYGGTGHTITLGLITNNVLWILAAVIGVYRLFTADRKHLLSEILIALAFFVQIYGYVKFFPAKHSQYLVPIALFVAYYAADGLALFFEWLRRAGGNLSLGILLFGFVYLLVVTTIGVNGSKLTNTNVGQLGVVTELLKIIPPGARVVDLEGRMLFWPEGYPVCCMTVDRALQYATRRPEPFARYLDTYPAQYIWDGSQDRTAVFDPVNQKYIFAHYEPVEGWGNALYALRSM